MTLIRFSRSFRKRGKSAEYPVLLSATDLGALFRQDDPAESRSPDEVVLRLLPLCRESDRAPVLEAGVAIMLHRLVPSPRPNVAGTKKVRR